MKKLCIYFLILTLQVVTHKSIIAQEGYNISFEINGLNDSILFLGSYYADKLTVEDTAFLDNRNQYVFEKDSLLDEGVYFIANQNKVKIIEFCLNEDQYFQILTDTSDYIGLAKIKDSKANQLFFDYQSISSSLFRQMKEKEELLKTTNSIEIKAKLEEDINQINKKNTDYKEQFIQDHPEHILSTIFLLLKEPEIPDSIKQSKEDSRVKAYNYYKSHYWDNINFDDPRLIRTPVFYNKLNRYFEQVIPKHPDSVIIEIDKIMGKSINNENLYKFLLFEFTSTYEQSNIMGYDQIFVHMVDKYFKDKEYSWVSPSMKKNMVERVERIKPLLIGNFAPELILVDTSGNFRSLYELRHDFNIIIFWTVTCGECKKEISALKELLQNDIYDIGVFSVNTDTSFYKWKEYIQKYDIDWINVNGTRSITRDYHILYDVYKTPTIYITDSNFKIIAKQLDGRQIGDFLTRYRKSDQHKNSLPDPSNK
ncbi:MAG: DUF5106 domain-containing protein [Bacteroidetes bacterium]|nr:DUF5106 domain-containing protein [Bacteroidota bacterium]